MELNGNTELQEIKIESSKSGDSGVAEWSHDSRENSTISIPVNSSSHNNNLSQKPQDVERKWRHFPGKNKFFCNGRLMTAPNISFCVCCFLLIVVTFFLFIIFDGPYLAKKWSIAVPILGVILFLVVITNMLKTTFSDPGIIPRASQQEVEHTERIYATNQPGRPPPRTKDENVNGQILKMKYCFTCKMFRPPRASHCGVCDNCVDRFDHHCPFLGNCIGKRNYPNFYGFVLSLSFLTVFVLSCAVAHLVLISKENEGNFLAALKESPTSAVVIIISFFGVWTVLGLAGFHTYLVSVEQTTNEDIKGVFGRSAIKNPFSRGNIFRNCSFVLCGPLQPSLIDPRGLVTEDFLLSLPKKLEVKGTLPSSVCNPNNFQNSIKTGPQCVENGSRPAAIAQFQRPTMTPQSLSMVHLPRSQEDNVQISTEIGDGIKLSRHSPDSGNGLLYTSASSSKSIGEVNSGKKFEDGNTVAFRTVTNITNTAVCRRSVNTTNYGKTRPYSQGDFLESRRSVVLVSGNNEVNNQAASNVLRKNSQNYSNSYPYNRGSQEKFQNLSSLQRIAKSSSYISNDDSTSLAIKNNTSSNNLAKVSSGIKIGPKNILNNNFVGKAPSALDVELHSTGQRTTSQISNNYAKSHNNNNKCKIVKDAV